MEEETQSSRYGSTVHKVQNVGVQNTKYKIWKENIYIYIYIYILFDRLNNYITQLRINNIG